MNPPLHHSIRFMNILLEDFFNQQSSINNHLAIQPPSTTSTCP
jgi:hypothetical protein